MVRTNCSEKISKSKGPFFHCIFATLRRLRSESEFHSIFDRAKELANYYREGGIEELRYYRPNDAIAIVKRDTLLLQGKNMLSHALFSFILGCKEG